MHPLETKAPKEGGLPLDKIESISKIAWITMERWNSLPSKRRHTASDGRRFAYLETLGGWIQIKIA